MCVIAIKPPTYDLLQEDHLKEMFDTNPNGSGFMYARDGKVRIRKGFMTLDALVKGLDKEKLTKADTVIYHFRIATHGRVTAGNTHPFPITTNDNLLQATTLNTDIGVAHNGILYSFGKRETESDTIAFVKEILTPKIIRSNLFEVPVMSLIELAMGSFNKFVFLTGDGKYHILGDWFKKNGIIYSNLNWEPTQVTTYHSRQYQGTESEEREGFFPARGLSKKARRQLRKAGFVENPKGVWRRDSTGTTASSTDEDDEEGEIGTETAIVHVPVGSTTCPNCNEYIFMKQDYCTKCGVFLDRGEDLRVFN